MPIVRMTLVQGREEARIQECMRAVARAVHETLGAPMGAIRVIVDQVPASLWMVGEHTRAELDAQAVVGREEP